MHCLPKSHAGLVEIRWKTYAQSMFEEGLPKILQKERTGHPNRANQQKVQKRKPNHVVELAFFTICSILCRRKRFGRFLCPFWFVFASKLVALGTILAPLVRCCIHVGRFGHSSCSILFHFGTLFTQLSSSFGTPAKQHLQKYEIMNKAG